MEYKIICWDCGVKMTDDNYGGTALGGFMNYDYCKKC